MHYQTQPHSSQNQMIIDPNDPQQLQQQISGEMSNVQPQQQQVIVQHNQQQPQQQQIVHQQSPQQHIVLNHGQNVVVRQNAQQPNQGHMQYVYDKRTIIHTHPQTAPMRANLVQQTPRGMVNNLRPRGQRVLIQPPQSNVVGVRPNANRFNRPVGATLQNNVQPPALVLQQNSQTPQQQHLVRTIPQVAVRPQQRNVGSAAIGVRPQQAMPVRQNRPPAPRTISLTKLTSTQMQRTGNPAQRMVPPVLSNLNKPHEQSVAAQSSTMITNNNGQQTVGNAHLVRRVSVSRANTSTSSEEYLALDDLEESIQAAKIDKHTPPVIGVPHNAPPPVNVQPQQQHQQVKRPLQSVVGTQQQVPNQQMHHVSLVFIDLNLFVWK